MSNQNSIKERILILNGQYAPGYRGGGPIQSCINLVENLYEYYDFYVLCADRDLFSQKQYSDVEIDRWTTYNHANVFYASTKNMKLKSIKHIINAVNADILYLNGFFSPIFTIRPLVLNRIQKLHVGKIILTPRGDFTGGCENKKAKKYTYIYASKVVGLYKNVLWHATSPLEENDIKNKFPNADVFVTPNLPSVYEPKGIKNLKKVGELNLVFVSRIFPKKIYISL